MSVAAEDPTPYAEDARVIGASRRPVYALTAIASLPITAGLVVWIMFSLAGGGMGAVIGAAMVSIAVAIIGCAVSLVSAIVSLCRREHPRWLAATALIVWALLGWGGLLVGMLD